jgi:hypothetical protein
VTDRTSHSRFSDNFGGWRRPAWCLAHSDFGWLYPDGSGSCFYDCVVEGAAEPCELVKGVFMLPRGTVAYSRAPIAKARGEA